MRIRSLTPYLIILLISIPVSAGVKISLDEEKSIDLGLRLQGYYHYRDSNVISDRDQSDFRIRRARIRVKAQIKPWLSSFLQTGYSEDSDTSNASMKIIDAYIRAQVTDKLQVTLGQHMAPALRQNITSAGAIMAIDRPSITYKSLTWGTRSVAGMNSFTMNNTDANLDGSVNVRDIGLTLTSQQKWKKLHTKYYLGIYDGAKTAQSDRLTARVQFNYGDEEKYFFNRSTYLGKKQTLSLGLSYDEQKEVARDGSTFTAVDYKLYSVDLFLEQKFVSGSLNIEAAQIRLELDDATQLITFNEPKILGAFTGLQVQGEGAYIQSGYYKNAWQPWLAFESWKSDADLDEGSFHAWKAGINYYFDDQKANLKIAYELLSSESAFGSPYGEDDNIKTFVIGLFVDL